MEERGQISDERNRDSTAYHQTIQKSRRVSPTRISLETKSPPIPEVLSSDIPLACRICWAEEDDTDQDGKFIVPCKCRGTSKYVHIRCLKRWILEVQASKGQYEGARCDVCLAYYRHLPPSFTEVRAGRYPGDKARRVCANAWAQALRSPAGPAIAAFTTSAWTYACIHGFYASISQILTVPSVLLQARHDPVSALRPILTKFATAIILEPFMSQRGGTTWFHIETLLFYSFGWILDATARRIENLTVRSGLASLPDFIQFAVYASLSVPKAIGIVLQALDLTLMALYGGGMSGIIRGSFEVLSTPIKALSFLARLGAAGVTVVMMPLARAAKFISSSTQ